MAFQRKKPTILIVAEDASATFGGEAVLPLHYFRRLRTRGVEVFLVVHARNRDPILKLFPTQASRITFVPDTLLHKWLWAVTSRLPSVVGRVFTGPLLNLLTQFYTRRHAKRIIREKSISVVHQPTPVSPKALSLMFNLGAPVVFGPLNGGMSYPSGFAHMEGRAGRGIVSFARRASALLHKLLPGKLRAHTVLVANDRTRRALPPGLRGNVVELVENGVDLKLWQPATPMPHPNRPPRFIFTGRLVDWKAVDLLLRAFVTVHAQLGGTLDIVGDGVERTKLESLAADLGIRSAVTFHGWLPQESIAAMLHDSDIFVLPSIRECGGAVVLEAMAAGVPVIATRWGGPNDYLDEHTGILVDPTNPTQFPLDLAAAMLKLATNPQLRAQLSAAASVKVQQHFDWERKIDRILEIYAAAAISR